MVQYPALANFPTPMSELCCSSGKMLHCRASSHSWVIGSMAFSVACMTFPSGMPTTFDVGFPVGMMPSCGLMNELVAPELMMACFPSYLSFSTLCISCCAFACCGLAWRSCKGVGGAGGGESSTEAATSQVSGSSCCGCFAQLWGCGRSPSEACWVAQLAVG